jgi:hypothetical protein
MGQDLTITSIAVAVLLEEHQREELTNGLTLIQQFHAVLTPLLILTSIVTVTITTSMLVKVQDAVAVL